MVDLDTSPPASATAPIYFATLQPLLPAQSNTGTKTCLWFCITLITFILLIMMFVVIAKSNQRRVMHSDKIIQNIDVDAWKKTNEKLLQTLGNLKRN